MISIIKKILSTKELRIKVVNTILLLFVCRIGVFIPVPGINCAAALSYFQKATGSGSSLFQLVDIFSGGAFAQMTVMALGVVPYISSSIIMQLAVAFLPSLQRELKENSEMGRRKISKYTRIFTIFLSMIQSFLFTKYVLNLNLASPGIVLPEILQFNVNGFYWLFHLITVSSMTAGTLFLMWLGEQITEKGIGNGVSLIITLGILSSVPKTVKAVFAQMNLSAQEPGQLGVFSITLLLVAFVGIVVATIFITEGIRKVPVQHSNRVVQINSGESSRSYIPLKVNFAGVIPVIFASSLLMFPGTFAQFMKGSAIMQKIAGYLSPSSMVYTAIFVCLVVFFTYFWTSTQFHPEQIASEMKRSGAFIPGIRQGEPTQHYLAKTMNKITLIGALFLAIIASLPSFTSKILKLDPSISYFFGGTTLLILVGVVLDTLRQADSLLIMKNYEGFFRKERTKIK